MGHHHRYRTEPDRELTRADLLLHYVQSSPHTLEQVDQLGNFLMGFGVLALGYMLNAELGQAVAAARAPDLAPQTVGVAALVTWGAAVALLVAFVHTYVFRVIAGRSAHAIEGDDEAVGEVLELPARLTWRGFMSGQRDFGAFLKTHYRPEDLESAERLLYARWSFARFMALKKLAEMDRMRRYLALALVSGVSFKLAMVALGAVVGAA